MNENEIENGNSQIPEVDELVIEDGDDTEAIKVKVTEHNQKVKERETKIKEANAQLYARTKKAEGFELVDGKWVKPETKIEKKTEDTSKKSKDGLTSEDVFVLVKADIPEEDIADVAEYAKLKNITIKEALATNVVKTILADKAEQRKIAEGTATGDGKKRGSGKLSDEALLSNAGKGIMPESDEDMRRLSVLQLNKNRK